MLLIAALALCLGDTTLGFAQSSRYRSEEAAIPKTPSKPSGVERRLPDESNFRCARYFMYKGRQLDCDTNVRRDGEKLRPIFKDVPEAIQELNTYQENRRGIRTAAYVGSLGLALIITSVILNRYDRPSFDSASGTPVINLGGYVALGGLSLATGSLIYGVSLSHQNESHLTNAVSAYNRARPDDPIELQFTTGFRF